MADELVSNKDIKKHAYPWVMNLVITLTAFSIFLNSIGFNLMQINGAITDNIVRKFDEPALNPVDDELKQQIIALTEQAEQRQLDQDAINDLLLKNTHPKGAK